MLRSGARLREVSVSLSALDGRLLGSIRAFKKVDGCFSEVDEAILKHLARLVAAFLERVHLYRRHLSVAPAPALRPAPRG